jgi:SAM-dependent MidA family methyltransferase
MKPSNEPPGGPSVLAALRARARGEPAVSFADFMEVALYEPGAGYYRRAGPRIGYGPGTDFLTATASAPLLGRLVAAACAGILGAREAAAAEFVEIGAEPGAGILGSGPHPFRSARQVRVGEPLRIEGPCVVFSNELFDAQPFRRFRFRAGAWRELGVCVEGAEPCEVELPPGPAAPALFPRSAPEGYVIDAPLASAELARRIAREPWTGLFLALDYGKSWQEIAHETPAGTARAYRGHAQVRDLLASPGGQDITCHVCWDWLAGALRESGFAEPRVDSMEAFFTRNCGETIAAVAAAEAGRMSADKLSLLQLLHPANLGQSFQALSAVRRAGSTKRAPAH